MKRGSKVRLFPSQAKRILEVMQVFDDPHTKNFRSALEEELVLLMALAMYEKQIWLKLLGYWGGIAYLEEPETGIIIKGFIYKNREVRL